MLLTYLFVLPYRNSWGLLLRHVLINQPAETHGGCYLLLTLQKLMGVVTYLLPYRNSRGLLLTYYPTETHGVITPDRVCPSRCFQKAGRRCWSPLRRRPGCAPDSLHQASLLRCGDAPPTAVAGQARHHLDNAWITPGWRPDNARITPGQRPDNARTICPDRPDNARTTLPGQRPENARTTPGQRPDNLPGSPGQRPDSTRITPGVCPDRPDNARSLPGSPG